jgi:hypothetical protein
MTTPSPNYYQGRNFIIYVNGIPVGCSKTCSIELTSALSNSTTKCDVDQATNSLWTHNTPQENSWKLTDSGTVPILNSSGQVTELAGLALIALQAAQTKCYVQFERFQNGVATEWIGGDGYITSCKLNADTTADLAYDITIDGTGPLSTLPVS